MTETLDTKKRIFKRIFICGSALRGQPDHQNLGAAEFVRSAATQPRYRLHAAADGWHPAIYEVESGGISIPGELYDLTQEDFDNLAAHEPPNLYPHEVMLEDGTGAIAFLYPQELVEKYQWVDISALGGWAAYKQLSA
jgi:gamma-glutamylaminecyclotransferase